MEYLYSNSPVKPGVIPPGAGGYVGFEDFGGVSGGSDYHRAYQTSMQVRFAPDTLAQSLRQSWDEPWLSEITPEKPEPVSMVGSDVFGPPSLHTTTRNSMLDPRGEAAFGVVSGPPPEGQGVVSWAAYSNPNGPASAGLACGTCSAAFAKQSPIASAPGVYPSSAVPAYGSYATVRSAIWERVRGAFDRTKRILVF